MEFTIFTPTYNRKDLLKNLYKSLQNQTFKDFEWIIVDDGSTDGTKEVVEGFLEENKIIENSFLKKKMDIKYFYKENGGKQRAYNFAVERAQGKFFICLDSDDEYVANGLQKIVDYWEKYEKNGITEKAKIVGMAYLSTYPDGKIIGTSFPKNEMIESQFDIYARHGVKGDKGLMFKTNIIKQYPFPVFDGEKFTTEAVVYNRIAEKYRIICINEKIEIKEYQNDGLTSKYNELLLKNPRGQALYHNERNRHRMTFIQSFLNNAVYVKFCKVAKYSFSKIVSESENKVMALLAYFVGLYMFFKEKKYRKVI